MPMLPRFRVFSSARQQARSGALDSARSTTAQTDAQLQLTKQQTILTVREAFTNLIIAKAAKKVAGRQSCGLQARAYHPTEPL